MKTWKASTRMNLWGYFWLLLTFFPLVGYGDMFTWAAGFVVANIHFVGAGVLRYLEMKPLEIAVQELLKGDQGGSEDFTRGSVNSI